MPDLHCEQFIAGAIQSAREKRPAKYPQGEAEEYFKSAQKACVEPGRNVAADASVPADLP